MSLPTATYRLQFRNGMDFGRAMGIVPYLARLGVSHLYASPLFQAMPGSSHGYDVTDHGRFDDSLGGMDGFLRLAAALTEYGMGLVLDIVPNHMAASVHNPWWRDVLRHGADSAFASHFDIDWSAPKLLLPILGEPYGRALEAGAFALGHQDDGPVWRSGDMALPLDPESWPLIERAEPVGLPQGEPAELPCQFAKWIADAGNAGRLAAALKRLSQNRDFLNRLHNQQPWRLAYWRAGRDAITYRRFFEISDLVGVRVEDARVFDDVHRFVFELLSDGHVHGLRIDHVDGLADPTAYLERLRGTAPGRPPIWVEKILAAEEGLPRSWPVAGTTGYEFMRLVGGILTDRDASSALTAAYDRFIGRVDDYATELARAKREILTHNLAAELKLLTDLLGRVAAADLATRDWGLDTLRRALIAIAVSMPVYRLYPDDADAGPLRVEILQAAIAVADLDDPQAVRDAFRLLEQGDGDVGAYLRARFQQTTAALMAKAGEDTAFYRYGRLLSANEVGAAPDPVGMAPETFQAEISRRAEHQLHGLNATATHDTKRGEDGRLRIAAIADDPSAWASAVSAWDALLAEEGVTLADAEMRWVFYQALLGAWQPDALPALEERLTQFLLKAAREAKLRTSWTREDAHYEQALIDFVAGALAETSRFSDDFGSRIEPFVCAGEHKSLTQLALKLSLPGIPDIYQGTEWADLSLVDPDNRRPVDFAARAAALDGAQSGCSAFDRNKMALMQSLLIARQCDPKLFQNGTLRWLGASEATLGFAREIEQRALLVLAELRPASPERVGAIGSGWDHRAFEILYPKRASSVQGRDIASVVTPGSPILVALTRSENIPPS